MNSHDAHRFNQKSMTYSNVCTSPMYVSEQVSNELHILLTSTAPIESFVHISRICDATSILTTLNIDDNDDNTMVSVYVNSSNTERSSCRER